MARTRSSAFRGCPVPKESPDTGYVSKPGTNPTLRGIPLAIAGSAAASFNFISSFLWGNAGFKALRALKELDDFEPRYDPTVIPIAKYSETETEFRLDALESLVAGGGGSVQTGSRPPYYGVVDYHSAYRNGEYTPTAVAKAVLQLIAHSDGHSTAFLQIREARVLEAAEASTRRYRDGAPLSVLDGVLVGVKDEVDLDGYEKSLGSCHDFTRPGGGTSWCVKKWEEAGAVIIGKLNMHELGLDTTNNNPNKGTPLNPHNQHYYTGGSSGGSGYVVSAGLIPIALGADGGGSIRLPASFCGIYGLKPSHGRVSEAPTTSLAASCGVLGPLASSMNDLEIAYRIMAIPDPNDVASSQFPPPNPPIHPGQHPKVIGIYKPWFESADGPVLDHCNAAISAYQAAGYTLVDISIPYLPEGQLAHAMTILVEIGSAVRDLTGLNPANKILLSVGKHTPGIDFLLAQKLRQLLMQHLTFLFQRHPGLLVLSPTSPIPGWHIAGGHADLTRGLSDANMSLRNMEYVWLANFTGCPALSIPVGTAKPKEGQGGVPIGLMAMAEWGAEDRLLEWGRVGEQWASKDKRVPRPAAWADVVAAARTKTIIY